MSAECPKHNQVWRGRGGLHETAYNRAQKVCFHIDLKNRYGGISTSNIQRGLRGILMLNGQLSILLLHHLDQ